MATVPALRQRQSHNGVMPKRRQRRGGTDAQATPAPRRQRCPRDVGNNASATTTPVLRRRKDVTRRDSAMTASGMLAMTPAARETATHSFKRRSDPTTGCRVMEFYTPMIRRRDTAVRVAICGGKGRAENNMILNTYISPIYVLRIFLYQAYHWLKKVKSAQMSTCRQI